MYHTTIKLAQLTEPFSGAEVVDEIPTIKGFEKVFSNTLVTVLSLSAVILFVMLIVGGFKYITAANDPKAAEAAKKTVTYAIGGIVLIALSYLIISIIQTFTGAPITNFTVTQ